MSEYPNYIIVPTTAMVSEFMHDISAMSVIDVDLNEIASELLEALGGRFESVNFSISRLMTFYESHGVGDGSETPDGRILADAAHKLAVSFDELIETVGLRDDNGVLYYVFEQFMPGSYDMVISWRY